MERRHHSETGQGSGNVTPGKGLHAQSQPPPGPLQVPDNSSVLTAERERVLARGGGKGCCKSCLFFLLITDTSEKQVRGAADEPEWLLALWHQRGPRNWEAADDQRSERQAGHFEGSSTLKPPFPPYGLPREQPEWSSERKDLEEKKKDQNIPCLNLATASHSVLNKI